MADESWMETDLSALRAEGLKRSLQVMPETGGAFRAAGKRILNFSSNDYLGLARNRIVIEGAAAALQRWGAGATASRLMAGTLPCHEELENKLAQFKGYPAALVFGSGYLANLGTVTALVRRYDRILADKLAHASLLDGALLSQAKVRRFQHNDLDHLRCFLRQKPAGARDLIVTESVFSMDGDLAPLDDLARLAQEHDAMLLVDEAHATGVWGPGGTGLISKGKQQPARPPAAPVAQPLRAGNATHPPATLARSDCGLGSVAGGPAVTVAMGTLSKALGAYGGFIAGSETLKRFLVNRARPFVFSTALPPACVGAALGALQVLRQKPGMGVELLGRAETFRRRLQAEGFNVGHSVSQIVPVIVGDNHKTLALARRLREQGIIAMAIRPPTVPVGTARLRLSLTLDHTPDDLDRVAEVLTAAARQEGLL
ncbi:MAG: 8-amino-7-oxononanoate synthase [Lentisphaerae bacterium]|nr:8-amino-7-oxononanoate synthase [Lentisphaerota bacterium]